MDTTGQAFPADSDTLKRLTLSPELDLKALNNFIGQASFDAFLMAETTGKVKAFKKLSLVYKLDPPYYSDMPKTLEMKSDTNFEYLTPSFKDKQNLPIKIIYSSITTPCKCVLISSSGDSQLKIEVEASKLSSKDFGVYSLNIQASNGVLNTNVTISFAIKDANTTVLTTSGATVTNGTVLEPVKNQVL